ncbi:c2h2 finger domain protein [Diplogelasinospora grovesii]|uniref:C2h2 finger domain protein n=1 Tax=Diplogelasinospora grovesii TaxID=303347 RepID=A0AAN6N387_9PEZI|nr:c2h2 finger domain protein [Diplogelasinospora grovesii]
MAPWQQTLPAAQTASARAALQSFHCELCQKGYSRMNEYEAHLSSYDHSHKQRLKDMKAMVRDPNATSRARKQEAKASGVISIKLGDAPASAAGAADNNTNKGGGGSGGGFKKGGFKKAAFKANAFAPVGDDAPTKAAEERATPAAWDPDRESDTEDEGYQVYDPRRPTP